VKTGLAVFRADAGKEMGAGHIMRCLAFAHDLSEHGWTCAFACTQESVDTVAQLARSPYEVMRLGNSEKASATSLLKRWPNGVDLLVVDHYKLDVDFESASRPWARRVMALDDMANRRHDCDILVDANFGRTREQYAGLVPSRCTVLTGSHYALLRSQFTQARRDALASRRERKAVERILVSIGGTDPYNLTTRVLEGISLSGVRAMIDVVMGAGAPSLAQVRQFAAVASDQVSVKTDVQDMASCMAAADLSIGSSGTTTWERCCLGLPSVVIVAAENQRHVAEGIGRYGAALIAGWHENVRSEDIAAAVGKLRAPQALERMSVLAAQLCDGLGTSRIAVELMSPIHAKDGGVVRLRPAVREDSERMFEWQTLDETRRYARVSEPPTWEEHASWTDKKLADADCLLNIVEHEGDPAGVLRLDRQGEQNAYEISILLSPDKYRRGIALAALQYARRLVPRAELIAEVHPNNEASKALFVRAGYEIVKSGRYHNVPTES
jgi:UDP-2,4-diacetamido-2,4,6-trideoxy-beta-L-altropyranose hydrolase